MENFDDNNKPVTKGLLTAFGARCKELFADSAIAAFLHNRDRWIIIRTNLLYTTLESKNRFDELYISVKGIAEGIDLEDDSVMQTAVDFNIYCLSEYNNSLDFAIGINQGFAPISCAIFFKDTDDKLSIAISLREDVSEYKFASCTISAIASFGNTVHSEVLKNAESAESFDFPSVYKYIDLIEDEDGSSDESDDETEELYLPNRIGDIYINSSTGAQFAVQTDENSTQYYIPNIVFNKILNAVKAHKLDRSITVEYDFENTASVLYPTAYTGNLEEDVITLKAPSLNIKGSNNIDVTKTAAGEITVKAKGYTYDSDTNSVATGYNTRAIGYNSSASGYGTTTIGRESHAEGEGAYGSSGAYTVVGPTISSTETANKYSVSDWGLVNPVNANRIAILNANNKKWAVITSITRQYGGDNFIITSQSLGDNLVNVPTEVLWGVAFGDYSHSEGRLTVAAGDLSHAEGMNTFASGESSHAEGYQTTASGKCSHVEGSSTQAQNNAEHAEGQYNASHKINDTYGNAGNTQHSVGIGTSLTRKNAVEIMQNGDMYVYGVGNYDGTTIKAAGNSVQTLKDVLDAKQGTLTAGTNISINDGIISATDTTYSNFGANSAGLVPNPNGGDIYKRYLRSDGLWVNTGLTIDLKNTSIYNIGRTEDSTNTHLYPVNGEDGIMTYTATIANATTDFLFYPFGYDTDLETALRLKGGEVKIFYYNSVLLGQAYLSFTASSHVNSVISLSTDLSQISNTKLQIALDAGTYYIFNCIYNPTYNIWFIDVKIVADPN